MVVDPSNPIGVDENGEMTRSLPDDQSAGSVVAAMLPTGAHYVKAFGTLGADSLGRAANRDPGGQCSSTPPMTTLRRRRSNG